MGVSKRRGWLLGLVAATAAVGLYVGAHAAATASAATGSGSKLDPYNPPDGVNEYAWIAYIGIVVIWGAYELFRRTAFKTLVALVREKDQQIKDQQRDHEAQRRADRESYDARLAKRDSYIDAGNARYEKILDELKLIIKGDGEKNDRVAIALADANRLSGEMVKAMQNQSRPE